MSQEGGYLNGEQTTPKKKSAATEDHGLSSLSIRQVLQCVPGKDDFFKLDNHEVSLVKIVGKVVELSEELPNPHIVIEDKTGMIQVGYYNTKLREDIEVNQYVKVFGKVRYFKEKYSINGYDIRRIYNFNEVVYHQLKVVQNYCYINGMTMSNAKKKLVLGDEMVDDLEVSDLSPLCESILSILRKSKESIGVHQDKIIQMLNDTHGEDKIGEAIVTLFNAGYIGSVVESYLKIN